MSNQSVDSSFLTETQGQITRELFLPFLTRFPKLESKFCFIRIGAGQSRDGGMKFQPAAERSLLIYSSSISESSCWFWGFFLYLDISESSLTRLIASFWPLKFNKLKACLKSFKFF